ncbi:MAG: hypothetical protein JO316_19505 [Abitibacteriaceae bacterium]|nr:hypothetical protein [Abditibacteriaceae bacterium]
MGPALLAIAGRLRHETLLNSMVYRQLGLALRGVAVLLVLWLCNLPAQAQTFRFNLRAEPDIIPANGISTTSILVQVQNLGGSSITAVPIVRFLTTRGSIESQARLTGGVARVLLRSSSTPGTAVVTAFVGTAREEVTVEFSDDESGMARFLVVQAPYVAYGTERGIITASGKSVFDFGDTHLESNVRLDVDLFNERIWAEGSTGRVLIRHGRGDKAHELRGDRLYYDMRRRRGVMRRVDTKDGPVRQEFMDSDFRPIPENEVAESPTDESDKDKPNRNKSPLDKSKANNQSKQAVAAQAKPANPSESTADAGAKAITPIPLDQVPGTAGTNEADKAKAVLGTGGAVAVQQPSEKADPAPELPAQPPATLGESPEPGLQPISMNGADGQVFKATVTTFGITPITIADALKTEGAASPDTSTSGAPKPRILTALNTETNPPKDNAGEQLEDIPNYQAIIPDAGEVKHAYKISEPLPPQMDQGKGYWITAHQVRVYPHDKIQFQHATVFFAGRKLFAMPLYVTSLSSAFNPATDMASFNSAGGLTLNVPYYYQASPHGTGTVYFQHAPSNGFAAERAGFALALEQEYWLSNQSQGHLLVDQIGHDWNLNWEHKLQFSPTTSGALYLDMPGHKSQYLRASLLKEFKAMQVGFESFYSRPEGQVDNLQGQFFARLRPRQVGHSQWTYTLAANALAQQRFTALVPVTVPSSGGIGGGIGGGDTGGGIGLPGQNPHPGAVSLRDIASLPTTLQAVVLQTVVLQNHPLYGQTLNATLQAPNYTLWKGGSLQASFMGVAYNYTDGRRGVAPGLSLGLQQRLGRAASLQLNYDYQRGGTNFFGADLTNLLTGSFSFNLKQKFAGTTLISKSLSDGALYGLSSLDYYVSPMWRVGLFSDYVHFANTGDFLNYGWSIGRALGQREVTLNWDHDRNRIYFEFGGLHY